MSPKRGDLFNAAITMNNSTQALYITCKYAIKQKFKYLEDEWAMMSSHIGKKEEMPFGKCWSEINNDLIKVIESDEFAIEKALICTTKLMLLNKRDSKKAERKHVQHLRNEVIGSFPEKATLSESGKHTFKDILPPVNDELYTFYNRILAGFSKMIADNNYDDMRMGLEYISRKKLILPVPHTFTHWPKLNDMGNDMGNNDIHMIVNDGDPCWFLWAMLFCIYPNNKNVATNFKLFCQNWRKNAKIERYGLLWGIPFLIDDYSDLIWTADDIEIFEKVKNITNELWTYTLNEHQEHQERNNNNKTTNKKSVEINDDKHKDYYNGDTHVQDIHKNKLALFGSFIPRKVATNIYDNIDPYDKLVETINYGYSGNGNGGNYENTTKMVRVNNKLIPNEQKKPNMLVNKV